MNTDSSLKNNKLRNKNKKLLLNIALLLNKELFDENKIPYKIFKYTEEDILKELKNYSIETKKTKTELERGE